MKKLLTILFFFISFNGISQEQSETLMYDDTFNCYGSCLDECHSVNVYVELSMWNDYDGGFVHINLYPDSSTFDGIRNVDIESYGCDDDGFYMIIYDNEWNIKRIQMDSDGVSILHKHNLFKKHWFIYH